MPAGNPKPPRRSRARSRARAKPAKVRYAVVGLGYIAQNAVLPAFAHARRNSELVALVSGDRTKLSKLGRRYGVASYDYSEYRALVASGEIDAVYIALPNSEHREAAVLAAESRVHVLTEKPMAVTPGDCEAMIEAAEKNGVALMVAYRLHFDRANLEAVRLVQDGKLGEPRHFDALFGMQVREGDIRLQKKLGGGVLEDLGIYCINAARYLFRDEPLEAWACAVSRNDARFAEVDEMITGVLRFPKDRVATFTCSFGSADVASYQVTGTKGTLRLDHAFEYSEPMQMELKVGERTRRREFPRRDQFAPELLYFSDCILEHREPEPSGLEGLADLRIIDALHESARRGSWVAIGVLPRKRRPTMAQEIHRPPVRKRELVHTKPPHVSP